MNSWRPYRSFHSHGATPIAGWFVSGKIPSRNRWWLGVPPFRKPPYRYVLLYEKVWWRCLLRKWVVFGCAGCVVAFWRLIDPKDPNSGLSHHQAAAYKGQWSQWSFRIYAQTNCYPKLSIRGGSFDPPAVAFHRWECWGFEPNQQHVQRWEAWGLKGSHGPSPLLLGGSKPLTIHFRQLLKKTELLELLHWLLEMALEPGERRHPCSGRNWRICHKFIWEIVGT